MELVVKQCYGCDKTVGPDSEHTTCKAYFSPEAKWSNGKTCPLASNVEKEVVAEKQMNPLKASKRKFSGK